MTSGQARIGTRLVAPDLVSATLLGAGCGGNDSAVKQQRAWLLRFFDRYVGR